MTQAIFEAERLETDADARMALTRLFQDLDAAEEAHAANLKTQQKRRMHGVKTSERNTADSAATSKDEELLGKLSTSLEDLQNSVTSDMYDAMSYTEREQYEAEVDESARAYGEAMRKIFESEVALPMDFTVDDSACERADNIYEFMTSSYFLAQRPFMAQALVMLQTFEDYCPRCSDTRLFTDYKVDDPHEKILEDFVLLEQGKCPHCRATKTDFVNSGEFNFYNELAMLAGQRCVAHDSLVETERGLETARTATEKARSLHDGSGNFRAILATHRNSPSRLYRVWLSDGTTHRVRGDHPFETPLGHVKACHLLGGMSVLVSDAAPAFPVIPQTGRNAARLYAHDFVETGRFPRMLGKATLGENCQFFHELLTVYAQAGRVENNLVTIAQSLSFQDANWLVTSARRLGLDLSYSHDKRLLTFPADNVAQWLQNLAQEQASPAADCLLPSEFMVALDVAIARLLARGFSHNLGWELYHRFLGVTTRYEALAILSQPLAESAWRNDTPADDTDTLTRLQGMLRAPTRSVVKVEVTAHCEETYDFTLSGEEHVYTCNGARVHNSGKSFITTGMLAYTTHYYLKLQAPQEVLGLSSSTGFVMSMVATKMAQGRNSLFDPYRSFLRDSPWFKNYHALLDEQKPRGRDEFYKLNELFVSYRHRGIKTALEAAHQGTLRGATRIAGAIDEYGHMSSDENSVTGGPLVYDAISRSLLTVRGAAERRMRRGAHYLINGLQFTISSPRHRRDPINTLYRQSLENKSILGIQMATWDINPDFPLESNTIQSELQKNYTRAMCDYGAVAPAATDPFFPSIDALAPSMVRPPRQLPCKRKVLYAHGVQHTTAELDVPEPAKWFRTPTLLSIDAGRTNNSFACSVIMLKGTPDEGYIPQVVALYEVQPAQGAPINFTMLFRDFIYPLIDVYNVKAVVADQWQSVKFLSDCADIKGVVTMTYSMKLADFYNLQSRLMGNEIDLPALPAKQTLDAIKNWDTTAYPACFLDKPIEHLYYQFMTVRRGTKTVEKGEGSTDDLFRSMAVGLHLLSVPDIWNALTQPEEEPLEATPAPYLSSFGTLGFGQAGGASSMTDSSNHPIAIASLRL